MTKPKKVIEILRPKKQTTALVFDSPHSGTIYPDDFAFTCDINDLRTAEDMYVDELFDHVPETSNAPLLKALFPRSYIDPNRKESGKKAKGPRGLCRTVCNGINRIPIYDNDNMPTDEDKQHRIETYYREYHENLQDIIQTTHQKFDKVLHINCHSMPSKRGDGSDNKYDIILGNREGLGHKSKRTCDPDLIDFLKSQLEDMGYKVGVNIIGYRGAEIVRRYGKPEKDIHSVQFEINRSLYMDEKTLQKTSNFNKIKNDLKLICTALKHYNPPKHNPPAANNAKTLRKGFKP